MAKVIRSYVPSVVTLTVMFGILTLTFYLNVATYAGM
jgi:hypothetical protein